MKYIHYISLNDFIANHVLMDGLTVIDFMQIGGPLWSVRVVDGEHSFFLCKSEGHSDMEIPMLFETPLEARKYIDDAVDDYGWGVYDGH